MFEYDIQYSVIRYVKSERNFFWDTLYNQASTGQDLNSAQILHANTCAA